MMRKRVTVTTMMMAVVMMICTAPSTALAQVTDPVIRILSLGSGWNANGATVAVSFVMGGETFELTGDDFSVEPAPVPEGETISLTITPGEGYVVDEVSVKKYEQFFVIGGSRTRGTDAEASVVVSHTDGTNVWSFTMPAFDAEATVTYKEKPKTVEATWIHVDVGNGLTYNGSNQTPGVTVKDGTKDITDEFEVPSYSNNTNAGEATVTVTAKATSTSYTGSASRKFTIAQKEVKVSGLTAEEKDYDPDNNDATIDCSLAVFSGLVNDDDILTISNVTGTYEIGKNEDATLEVTLDYSQATLGGSSAGNYTLASEGNQATTTITIHKVKKYFTITFDPNGGKGEMSAIANIEEGERIKLTPNSFTRSGYDFKNWNTKADGSGDKHDDKSALQINDDITLYAQWMVKPLNPDPVVDIETVSNPDGSQTTTTSQTLETDNAGYPINIGNDNVVWQKVKTIPALRNIIGLDPRKNVELLVEQGCNLNVMLTTVTETNAQGQTTAISSSMTIKQTATAEDGTPAGPTKIAIYAGGGSSSEDTSGDDGGNRYTIRFVSEGAVLISKTYAYDDIPVVPPAPTKAEDNENTYIFKGWTPSISRVTGNATYTAEFEAIPKISNRYTILFVSEGSLFLAETYEYDDMPVVPPTNPTMDDDDDYTYTFKEWTPSIARVTGNATYTAVFTATPKNGGDNGGGSENPDTPTSGEFGNYTWEVSKSDGSTVYDVLTISGEGKMDNGSPWSAFKDQIKTVYINEGETEIDKVVSRIIGKDVFAGYTGDHVYVTVPKGKILSVILNMSKVWTDLKSREIIRPTDGKVDIIDYLFANSSERTSNRELPIAVDEIYPHLKKGDTFTLASKNIGNLNTVSIPYKCYQNKDKNGKALFGKAEMKALDIDVEYPSVDCKDQIGLTVDATLTAELVAETDDTYMVTENKATKLTFGKMPTNIANGDTYLNRPENISFNGADIDTKNIDFSNGCILNKGDQITLVNFYREGDETDATVGTITQAGIGNASFNGKLLLFTLEYGTSEYYSQGSKDQAMTTLTVNYTTNGATASGHFNGVKMDGRAVPEKDSGGRVNWTAQSGSRAVTTEEEEEDDEIEIVSGQEYEIISDGYIVLNFYTPDAPITVNSVIIRSPGDANGDDKVNAKDIVEMVNEMDPNRQPSDNFKLKNADMNNDKKITQDDIDAVVDLILQTTE